MSKREVALLIAASLASSAILAADPPTTDRAKALVKAMRSDESVAIAVAMDAASNCRQSAANQEGQCDKLAAAIRQVIDRERVIELLTPFFGAQFGADEVEALIGYYDSDAGRRATATWNRALVMGAAPSMPEFDEATQRAYLAFQQTPAARKLAALAPKFREEGTRRVGPYLCKLLEPTGLPCAALTRMAAVAAWPAMLAMQPSGDALDAYQRDADIVRARYLLEWGTIIEAYYAKSGRYPLQDRAQGDALLRVRIATPEQQSFLDPAQGNFDKSIALDDPRFTPVSMKEFVADIEAVLGREIDERYDPQRVPTGAPNFFSYFATKDGFLLWVMCRTCPPELRAVTIPLPPARTFNIGSPWFIRNVPGTQSLEGLRANKDFARFIGNGPKRTGWFEVLARDQAHESKR